MHFDVQQNFMLQQSFFNKKNIFFLSLRSISLESECRESLTRWNVRHAKFLPKRAPKFNWKLEERDRVAHTNRSPPIPVKLRNDKLSRAALFLFRILRVFFCLFSYSFWKFRETKNHHQMKINLEDKRNSRKKTYYKRKQSVFYVTLLESRISAVYFYRFIFVLLRWLQSVVYN